MTRTLLIVGIFVVILLGGYLMVNSGRPKAPSVSNEALENEPTSTGIELTTDDGAAIEEEVEGAVKVNINNYKYSPSTIKVKKGGSVTWTNNDSVAHTATGDNNEFDTGLLNKGESKTVNFTEAGTFAYHCTPHPYMKATVVVE